MTEGIFDLHTGTKVKQDSLTAEYDRTIQEINTFLSTQ